VNEMKIPNNSLYTVTPKLMSFQLNTIWLFITICTVYAANLYQH